MSKAIVTVEALSIAQTINFKDNRLAAATAKIIKLYDETTTYVERKNREFASILSTVKSDESYKADGFKSVADYANAVFGISRSNAYALAAAGDVYNDSSVSQQVKALSPSKMFEVSNVPHDRLEADIKAGVISTETSQKDLREYAKAATGAAAEDTKVLPQFTARLVADAMPESLAVILDNVHIMEDWENEIVRYITDTYQPSRAPEIIKLPKCSPHNVPTQKKKPISRLLFITEDAALAFEFYEKTPERPGNKSQAKPKFSKEELLAMLAEMEEDEQNAQ